jgi:hypothetical protein
MADSGFGLEIIFGKVQPSEHYNLYFRKGTNRLARNRIRVVTGYSNSMRRLVGQTAGNVRILEEPRCRRHRRTRPRPSPSENVHTKDSPPQSRELHGRKRRPLVGTVPD